MSVPGLKPTGAVGSSVPSLPVVRLKRPPPPPPVAKPNPGPGPSDPRSEERLEESVPYVLYDAWQLAGIVAQEFLASEPLATYREELAYRSGFTMAATYVMAKLGYVPVEIAQDPEFNKRVGDPAITQRLKDESGALIKSFQMVWEKAWFPPPSLESKPPLEMTTWRVSWMDPSGGSHIVQCHQQG